MAAKKKTINLKNITPDSTGDASGTVTHGMLYNAKTGEELLEFKMPKTKRQVAEKIARTETFKQVDKGPVKVAVKNKGKTNGERVEELMVQLIETKRPLMKISTPEEIQSEVDAMPEIESSACIKDVACQLLTAVRCDDPEDKRRVGFSYASILHKIALMFPNSTTSNACLRWYLVRIRQEIEGFDRFKMPIKFKRPKSML